MFAGLVFAGVGLAGACGGDDGGSSAGADSGSSSVVVGSSICPSPNAAPKNGDLCLLPQGATCAFGECGSSIAECVGGVWIYAGNPTPQPICPSPEPPAEGTACPPCWRSADSCSYGSADCSSPDASANRAIATCPNGLWKLDYFPCASQDAGPSDGGPNNEADVQGDAGLDAD
jgi:hypothetical protein